jgi:hypothetical protein
VIISAGTVRDRPDDLETLVRRNLHGGLDHLVLFLDAPWRDVEEHLDDHPDVTAVRAYGDWWAGQAQGSLKERRILNAGLLSRLVAGCPWAEWVFHLGDDEVARIDRAVLDRLGPETPAVALTGLEAVSSLRPTRSPTLFKQVPDQDVLTLLASLGVIAEAKERAYLRASTAPTPGLRPSADLTLGLHHVLEVGTGERVSAVTDPGLRVLRYDSVDPHAFARKWTGAGSAPGGTPLLAEAVSALLALDLTDEARARWSDRLFERFALDDVETLTRLGLLVEIDPDVEVRPAAPVASADVAQLRTLLDRAHEVPKLQFRPRATNGRAPKTLARLRRGV